MARKRSNVLAHLMRSNLVAPPAAPRETPRNPWIGHNRGPEWEFGQDSETDPSDAWRLFCWAKAHAEAWKTPPREVALRRLARAEALGLSYRAYTAVILDTGRFL